MFLPLKVRSAVQAGALQRLSVNQRLGQGPLPVMEALYAYVQKSREPVGRDYTGQSMASAMKAKIMETLPIENRSRSDIAYPIATVTFDVRGRKRVHYPKVHDRY